jgi:hypothetical protein
MSDKHDTGTDRRALIAAAAAAAGVAAASVSHAAETIKGANVPPIRRGAPTQVKVDLGGVHLPDAVAKQLESQINSAVLRALGQAGIKGQPIYGGIRPPWIGIIWKPAFEPNATGGPG